jgi:hypothetical protein
MPMESTFADITVRSRQSKFTNEQAVSQGIVIHIVQELGWDTWETGHAAGCPPGRRETHPQHIP